MKKTGGKLVGRNKGSLTEQQTKGTGTTKIQIRRKTQQRTARPRELFFWTGPAPALLSR